MCTRERDTGRRDTVTFEEGSAMMEEQKKEIGGLKYRESRE
jgi:hypothetical protein